MVDTFWWRVVGCLEREKEKRKIFHINKWLCSCDYIMYIYLKFCLVSTYFFRQKMIFFIHGPGERKVFSINQKRVFSFHVEVCFFSYYLPKEKSWEIKLSKHDNWNALSEPILWSKLKSPGMEKVFFKSQNPLLKSSELVFLKNSK